MIFGAFLLVAPAILVLAVAILALFYYQRKRSEPFGALAPRFFAYVIGGGAIVFAVMLLLTIVLEKTTEFDQAPLWLIFMPWSFTLGELVGLGIWMRQMNEIRPASHMTPVH